MITLGQDHLIPVAFDIKTINKIEKEENNSTEVETIYVNCLSTLSTDFQMEIFSFLSCSDLVRVSRVCRDWNETCKIDYLWESKPLYQEIYAKISGNFNFLNYYKERGADQYLKNSVSYGLVGVVFAYAPIITSLFSLTYLFTSDDSEDMTKTSLPDYVDWNEEKLTKKDGLVIPEDLNSDQVLSQNIDSTSNKPIRFPVKDKYGYIHEHMEILDSILKNGKCPNNKKNLQINEIRVVKSLYDKIEKRLCELGKFSQKECFTFTVQKNVVLKSSESE